MRTSIISWYDFAREIMTMSNLPCVVQPIRTEEYPTAAQRPQYSIFDLSKIKRNLLFYSVWKDSLKRTLQEIKIMNREVVDGNLPIQRKIFKQVLVTVNFRKYGEHFRSIRRTLANGMSKMSAILLAERNITTFILFS